MSAPSSIPIAFVDHAWSARTWDSPPRQYQSGDVDRSGHISKCGDTLARLCLYEAATVIMTRVKRPLGLKVWAMKIAKRSGTNKARVALARKLAVILHSIWRTGEAFRWGTH
jgi:transposase